MFEPDEEDNLESEGKTMEAKDESQKAEGALNEEEAGSPLNLAKKESRSSSLRRSAVILQDGRRSGSGETVSTRPHDFRKPTFIGDGDMLRLQRMHEELVASLEAQASLFLRSEVEMSLAGLEVIEYRHVLDSLESITHLTLFRADPLPGIGILVISPQLALTVVNQVLGGKGQAPKAVRNLTKIEIGLIEEFLLILIRQWCEKWEYETTPVGSIVGHETVPSALQVCEQKTSMLRLNMDVKIREGSGRVQVAVPLYMVEPLVRHINSQQLTKPKPAAPTRPKSWQQGYENVPLPGDVSVAVGRMTIGKFNSLKVGDTVPLADGCMEQAVLKLARKPVFVGQFGVDEGKMALSIQTKL